MAIGGQALLFGVVVTYMAGLYLRDANAGKAAASGTVSAASVPPHLGQDDNELGDEFDEFSEPLSASASSKEAAPEFSGNGLQVFIQYCMSCQCFDQALDSKH